MTTVLVNDRETALRVGYEATDWNGSVSFDDYRKAMESWTIQCIVRNDECIGSLFRKDDEIHVSILPAWRGKWATKGFLRQLLQGSRVVTKVAEGHDYMFSILQRLNFKQSDNGLFIKEHRHGY